MHSIVKLQQAIRLHISVSFRTRLIQIMALAVLYRAGVFSFLCFYPMSNEVGLPISPLLLQQGTDMDFYLGSLEQYRTNIWSISEIISGMFVSPIETWERLFIISGPLQPGLLALFQYSPHNTFPLALFYLVMSSILTCIWLKWLSGQDIPTFWLVGFALIPNPVWFMICISADLPFALLFSLFFMTYFSQKITSNKRLGILIVLLITATFSRPNALSLLLFVIVDQLLNKNLLPPRFRWQIGAIGILLFAPICFFYIPYLISFLTTSGTYTYFGFTQREYLEGAFDNLPTIFNYPISWLTLLAGKICYFVGIRPSYGDTELPLVLLRSAGGLVLLPGLVFAYLRGNRSMVLLVSLYLIPIFLGATQDRYNLAIMPILFGYGVFAIMFVWQRLSGSSKIGLRDARTITVTHYQNK